LRGRGLAQGLRRTRGGRWRFTAGKNRRELLVLATGEAEREQHGG